METVSMKPKVSKELIDVMFRVKRGLCGYVSYLAACEMNAAFSEYILYEPILRIMTARGFIVECEYVCPGIQHSPTGDKKRLDFYAKGAGAKLAIEVKWVRNDKPKLDGDINKLRAVLDFDPEAYPLLVLFGRKSHIEHIHKKLDEEIFSEAGDMVEADFRKTKFACRVFRLKKPK